MIYTKKDVDKKITLVVSGKHEGTAEPWWLIIDPRQNLETKNEQALHNIAGMITGPFFSRVEAQNFLEHTRYNFGKNAHVFCHSGYYTHRYKNALRDGIPVEQRTKGE